MLDSSQVEHFFDCRFCKNSDIYNFVLSDLLGAGFVVQLLLTFSGSPIRLMYRQNEETGTTVLVYAGWLPL